MDPINPITILPSNAGKILEKFLADNGIRGYCAELPASYNIPIEQLFDGSRACVVDLNGTFIHPQLGEVDQILNYDAYLEIFRDGADVCAQLIKDITNLNQQFCADSVIDNSLQVYMHNGVVKLTTADGGVLEMQLSEFITHLNNSVETIMRSDLKGFATDMYNQISHSDIPQIFLFIGILFVATHIYERRRLQNINE